MVLTDVQGKVDSSLQFAHQPSLFDAAPFGCRSVSAGFSSLDPSSSVLFQPGWVTGSERVFDQLRDEMPWRAVERPMYDRVVAVPRLICTVEPESLPNHHPLKIIRNALEHALEKKFLSVGLNYYPTGQDSVAWHRDRIGRDQRPSTVVLVSLGSPRTLAMRPRAAIAANTTTSPPSTPATRLRWRLGHGDLFVMNGACQRDWEHSVPKEREVGPRISLAFRCREALGGPRKGRTGVPPLLASHNLQ